MRAKTYKVLARAVEEGIARGWNRAHKPVENPTEEQVKIAIEEAVLGEICEVFTFDDEERTAL